MTFEDMMMLPESLSNSSADKDIMVSQFHCSKYYINTGVRWIHQVSSNGELLTKHKTC